jgi:hypothetical protein
MADQMHQAGAPLTIDAGMIGRWERGERRPSAPNVGVRSRCWEARRSGGALHLEHPSEPDVLPRADAIVVAPATFNTVNKWVAGAADTLVLSLLSEYVGFRTPIVLAPNVNPWLGQHPGFLRNLDELRSWGVLVLHNPMASPPTWMVPWAVIHTALRKAVARPTAYPPVDLGGDEVL